MSYRTLIIGCGSIAGGLDDFQVDTARPPFTHVKAYKENEDFQTVACIDPNPDVLASFQQKWSIEAGFVDIDDALRQGLVVDVVSICSPTKFHGEHLAQVLSLNPKLVFCEKPIHENYLAADAIVQKYKSQNVGLVMNYSRRFDEELALFKKALMSGNYGELRAIHGWYNKGLLNNGSHLLDVLCFLLGKLSVNYVGQELFDFTPEDPSIPIILSTREGITISLSCGDGHDFSLFELDFVFSNARVKMLNSGLRWSVEKVIESDLFNGYKTLGPPAIHEGGYSLAFENALVNIHSCLSSDAYPLCSGEDGLSALQLYSQIKSKVRSN